MNVSQLFSTQILATEPNSMAFGLKCACMVMFYECGENLPGHLTI